MRSFLVEEWALVVNLATTALLLLTLAFSMLTFAAPRANVLFGAAHLQVFFAYLLFIFER